MLHLVPWSHAFGGSSQAHSRSPALAKHSIHVELRGVFVAAGWHSVFVNRQLATVMFAFFRLERDIPITSNGRQLALGLSPVNSVHESSLRTRPC